MPSSGYGHFPSRSRGIARHCVSLGASYMRVIIHGLTEWKNGGPATYARHKPSYLRTALMIAKGWTAERPGTFGKVSRRRPVGHARRGMIAKPLPPHGSEMTLYIESNRNCPGR